MAFLEAWTAYGWYTKEKYLPRIEEAGEDDQLEEKLRETVSTLTEQAEDKQIELTNAFGELSRNVARLQAVAEETQTGLENCVCKLTVDVSRLQATQDRQNLLLCVVIGLLVWLLIKLIL